MESVDLFASSNIASPYATYATLREQDPVHWSSVHDAWILTRYDDVAASLRDPRLGAGRIQEIFARLPVALREELPSLRRVMERWLVFLDPPEHTQLRELVSYAFKPGYLDDLRGWVAELAGTLVEGLIRKTEADLIRDYAYPLPALVIGRLLGAGSADLQRLKTWSDSFAQLEHGPAAFRFAEQCTREMQEFLLPAIEKRRRRPGPDIISALVEAERDGELLDPEDIVATCILLLFAGHETTTNLIGNSARLLMLRGDLRRELANNDALVSGFIEELLRFEAPVQRVRRVVVAEHGIRGKRLRLGDQVWLMVGAANRDGAAFQDPDQFRLDREGGPRCLTFGQGPHFCLGAHLGRMEGVIGVRALLEPLENGRSGVPLEDLRWRSDLSFRGLDRLPISFAAPATR